VASKTREDVEFVGHGDTVLRGWLYRPDSEGPVPGVVMAHGFSATKEMALDGYAEVFAEAGLCVLVYDHRNLGASDGEPRQEINPWAQARDYRHAIGWLGARPEVDAERIGIWGSSFSGGEVIVLGACDERVKAVVANVPFAALGGETDYADTRARFEAMRSALLDESGRGPADALDTPTLGPVPVVEEEGTTLPALLPQPESKEWFLRLGAEPESRWQNEVTLRSTFGTEPVYDPGVCVEYIAPTPLLMVVASDDRLAATADSQAAYERAGEPKRLVMVEGHHFSPYEGKALARASKAARDFLLEHL
jgi:fermentation-respiration switch protein FrsA (DUF1100 family)